MSSANSDAPLSMLAMSLMEADETPEVHASHSARDFTHSHEHAYEHDHAHEETGHTWVSFIFYFLVLALIFYFLYFALRPSFVLENDDCSDSKSFSDDHFREISNGKLLAAAVITALILMFVFWLFSCLVNY